MDTQNNLGMQQPGPVMSTPKSHAPMIAIAVLVTALIVGGIAYAVFRSPAPTPVVVESATPTASASSTLDATTTPTTVAQSKVFSNSYLSATIPSGWTYSTAKSGAAINIMKDGYILYINTRASQTSGAEGGRFGEIAQGAPSVSAVVADTSAPNPAYYDETGWITERNPAGLQGSRTDLYDEKSGGAWFFSFIAKGGGYFTYYDGGPQAGGLVITMAYDSKDVNMLPQKDSAKLNAMLAEMTSIAATLKIKENLTYTNTKFGFSLSLPQSWTGYSVVSGQWQAYTNDETKGDVVRFTGPQVSVRNPKWTSSKPYQDIPVMVITHAQWNTSQSERGFSWSAAPVGPTELGRNGLYVFALPPRWVGFVDTLGQQEAQDIVKTFKAF